MTTPRLTIDDLDREALDYLMRPGADLADRLQQYIADRLALPHEVAATSMSTFSPQQIRNHADDLERDERQHAADTRDRELAETLAKEHLTHGCWTATTPTARASITAAVLAGIRAGRDDREADHG